MPGDTLKELEVIPLKTDTATLVVILISLAIIVSCGTSGISGSYAVTRDTAAANSLDNLVQLDECIERKDTDCEMAMVADGRAFLVKAGTSIDATEVGDGALVADVRSGSLVGKRVYLPVGAVK